MARRCMLTGKGVLTGNNVSHANNKTRRRYLPNLQDVTVLSDALNQSFRLRLSMHALRSIEKRGGIDAYLLKESSLDLPEGLRRLRKRIIAARAAAAAEAEKAE